LTRYDHHVVVANLLHNRNRLVTLILKEEPKPVEIVVTDQQLADGNEIEEKIVEDLTERHQKYVDSKLKL
jgi:hypothetical protein